jgi:uncharacterized membrane protein SpoIIM required for sporulation
MDIDRFIARNRGDWARLDALAKRARSAPRSLDEAELVELLGLYHRCSAQLSHARSTYRDPQLTAELTRAVAHASAAIYSARPRSPGALRRFFTVTFPGALWHTRRYSAVAAAFLFVPALVIGAWLVASPAALEASAPAAEREIYAQELFEAYYTDTPSTTFATLVGVNNVNVSFMAFAGGAAALLPGIFILVINGLALGQAGAWMTTEGQAVTFWTLIAPHGLLELTAVVLAGGAGLLMGWTLLVPGEDRNRPDALAEEARRAGSMILGLVACFAVAALIEGYVTGSTLPIGAKVATGVGVWVLFLGYVATYGRRAADAGLTGQLGELDDVGAGGPSVTGVPRP